MEALLETKNIWDRVLDLIKNRLNKQIFDTWFLGIKFEGCDERKNTLRLRTKEVTKDWVCSWYSELIDQCMRDLGVQSYTIEWEIEDEEIPVQSVESEHDDDNFQKAAYSHAAAAGAHSRSEGGSGTSKRTQGSTNFVDIEPIENSLSPKYTFEKFVVGSCNQFAHAASKGAAETPGRTYNPLFIYGETGLGKTHLMHAIGHSVKERDRHLRVAYITSEVFMNELINAIRYDRTPAFREKYRSIDVLLMDDIQFMAGKERTQEEFFHTFNALHNDQKQIVVTSDCPPREIPTLQERLHSRFEWGLIADIEPPDLETKVAILKRKADMDGIDLPDDIAIFIAGKVKSNVRELEGSLTRLLAISSLKGVPISKMLAQDALKNIIDSERPEGLTMERIARVVALHYKLTVEELKSKNNSRAISQPRQIAMYLSKRLTKSSYPEIGREFGGKHHTTVMHSYDKIENLTKHDQNFHRSVSEFIDILCS
ncbi:MAG: chromosomal replication initiator protein DnaA [Pyrinomonadaceae bacterium]